MTSKELRKEFETIESERKRLALQASGAQAAASSMRRDDERRPRLLRDVSNIQDKLRELNIRKKRVGRRMVDAESVEKFQAQTSLSDHFVQVAKRNLPRETFKEWMRLAARDFEKSFSLELEEVRELA